MSFDGVQIISEFNLAEGGGFPPECSEWLRLVFDKFDDWASFKIRQALDLERMYFLILEL